ncbi:MAG: O-methyltransferase [Acholeplasmatales bacterium]|nr:O-methyltransferase [Acholeplasmatales bacterium]
MKNNILFSNSLEFSPLEEELREYAKLNNVPIIQDEGLAMLEMVIRLYKPKNILEIGTAIGYSAIRMAKVCNSNVYTIERNELMENEAIKNVSKANLSNNIHLIFKDALEAYDLVSNVEFDMIFIDAAKAQYMKFFNLYTPLLKKGGVVVCDNMAFHGLVELINDEKAYMEQSRSVRGLIRKMAAFHDELLKNDDYYTSLFEVGDGIAISVKK